MHENPVVREWWAAVNERESEVNDYTPAAEDISPSSPTHPQPLTLLKSLTLSREVRTCLSVLYRVRSGDSGQGLIKMAEMTVFLQQVRALQQQVESLQGLQTVVEEQRAVIMELRALLDARKAQGRPVFPDSAQRT